MGSAAPQQITIFYSGTVNVYDDVPSQKAQAIMLLLSDHGSSNTTSTDNCKDLSMQSTLQPQGHLLKGGVLGSAKALQAHAPITPSTITTTDNAPITQSVKKLYPMNIMKRSQAELPFARKASLARFLEKRKDRVLEAIKVMNQELGATTDSDSNEVSFCSPFKSIQH